MINSQILRLRHIIFQTLSQPCDIIYWIFLRKYYEFGLTQPCLKPQQDIMSFPYQHKARIRRCKIRSLNILNSILVALRNNTVFEISFSCISKVRKDLSVDSICRYHIYGVKYFSNTYIIIIYSFFKNGKSMI